MTKPTRLKAWVSISWIEMKWHPWRPLWSASTSQGQSLEMELKTAIFPLEQPENKDVQLRRITLIC